MVINKSRNILSGSVEEVKRRFALGRYDFTIEGDTTALVPYLIPMVAKMSSFGSCSTVTINCIFCAMPLLSSLTFLFHQSAPDSGRVFFDGHQLTAADTESIGYLPEERGLYKKMKVGEQALFFARLKGLPKHDAEKRLRGWFEHFGISDWWNKKVSELSKGMAQKIQFGSQLVTIEKHPTGVRRCDMVDDSDKSGFAGTVGA